MEGLVHHAGQLVHVLHEVVVLAAWPRDPGGVGLLERIVADQVRRHLPGEADDRDRIHQRVGETGHGVGGARPGGHEHDPDLAGRACIAFGGMDGAALLPDQDVTQRVLLEQRVVDRQDGATGIAEDEFYALVHQRLEDDFRTRHLGLGGRAGGIGDGGHLTSRFLGWWMATLRCTAAKAGRKLDRSQARGQSEFLIN